VLAVEAVQTHVSRVIVTHIVVHSRLKNQEILVWNAATQGSQQDFQQTVTVPW